jgi:hypothetical protein
MTVRLEPVGPEHCTGLTASWCPVHGDCRCRIDGDLGERSRDATDCSLHAWWATHGGPS